MTTYAVALRIKKRAPFYKAWEALEAQGIATQSDQDIPPHYGLAHGAFDERTFSAEDFWKKFTPQIPQAALSRVEAIYDAPLLKDNGSLLIRPYFPFEPTLIPETQTAIMRCFGWGKDQQDQWRRRGRHTTLGTGVKPEQKGLAFDAVHDAWKDYTPIVTGFDAVILYRFDEEPTKKFTELYRQTL